MMESPPSGPKKPEVIFVGPEPESESGAWTADKLRAVMRRVKGFTRTMDKARRQSDKRAARSATAGTSSSRTEDAVEYAAEQAFQRFASEEFKARRSHIIVLLFRLPNAANLDAFAQSINKPTVAVTPSELEAFLDAFEEYMKRQG